MPHPKTKADLLAQARAERAALLDCLAALSPDEMNRRGPYGWAAKDFVAHLAEWERLLFGWYESGLRGEKPELPAKGYTWRTMDDLNAAIFERFEAEPAVTLLADWQATSGRLIELTESLPEAELFEKKRFDWTGSTSMAVYVDECGPNHYRWARAEIEKGLSAGR